MFWAADYGNLTFTSDHGLYRTATGSAPATRCVYPGAAPETGEQADQSFYPDAPRINTVVTALRHARQRARLLGLDGQRVRITNNHIYGNSDRDLDRHDLGRRAIPASRRTASRSTTTGSTRTTSTCSSANPPVEPAVGHPARRRRDLLGRPQQRRGSTTTGSGTTGARAPGCSRSPTFLVTPEGNIDPGGSCTDPAGTLSRPRAATSTTTTTWAACRRVQAFPSAVDVRQPRRHDRGAAPNGVDFWWDEGARHGRQLLVRQHRLRRHAASVTGLGRGRRRRRPAHATRNSIGDGDSVKLGVPARPASSRARATLPPSSATGTRCRRSPGRRPPRAKQQAFEKGAREFLETARAKQLEDRVDEITGIPTRSLRSSAMRNGAQARGAGGPPRGLLLASCGGDSDRRARRSSRSGRCSSARWPRSPSAGTGRAAAAPSGWRRSRTSASRST